VQLRATPYARATLSSRVGGGIQVALMVFELAFLSLVAPPADYNEVVQQ